jgi:hypothetical protein
MSEFRQRLAKAVMLLAISGAFTGTIAAQTLTFSKRLTVKQAKCLSGVVKQSIWKDAPDSYPKMRKFALVATTHLCCIGWHRLVRYSRMPNADRRIATKRKLPFAL